MSNDPVFVIGVPRSGTTIVFEAFAKHEALGGPTNYTDRFPRWPSLGLLVPFCDNRLFRLEGAKRQHERLPRWNRYVPRPAEAYGFWDYYTETDFSGSYLLGETAPERVRRRLTAVAARLLRYQRRSTFVAKLTGPPRIGYLRSIFPDARFIHVIRDGRAVVHSLLNVAFWRDNGGLERPWWSGGLTDQSLDAWRASGGRADVLAALQWKTILDVARRESAAQLDGRRYLEIRYESFVADPDATLTRMYDFCGLPPCPRPHEYLSGRRPRREMKDRYRADFSEERIQRLTETMEPWLSALGYEPLASPSRSFA